MKSMVRVCNDTNQKCSRLWRKVLPLPLRKFKRFLYTVTSIKNQFYIASICLSTFSFTEFSKLNMKDISYQLHIY